MSKFDRRKNMLWESAIEIAELELNMSKDEYPDTVEDLAEQLWIEMCENEKINPYE